MSKIHILERRNEHYRVILHTPTPEGNNAGNEAWSDILVVIGAHTTMVEGNGPGQISHAEANSIAGGDIIEIVAQVAVEARAGTPISLDEMADPIIRDEIQKLQAKYKYYGYEQ